MLLENFSKLIPNCSHTRKHKVRKTPFHTDPSCPRYLRSCTLMGTYSGGFGALFRKCLLSCADLTLNI